MSPDSSSSEVRLTEKDWFAASAAFVMMALTIGVLIVNLVLLSDQAARSAKEAQDAAETHAAVCTFRGQLVAQLKASQDYLRQHPDGAPALHISAAQLQQTIDREQSAVDSLAELHCG